MTLLSMLSLQVIAEYSTGSILDKGGKTHIREILGGGGGGGGGVGNTKMCGYTRKVCLTGGGGAKLFKGGQKCRHMYT